MNESCRYYAALSGLIFDDLVPRATFAGANLPGVGITPPFPGWQQEYCIPEGASNHSHNYRERQRTNIVSDSELTPRTK